MRSLFRILLTACLFGQAVLLRAEFKVPDYQGPVLDQAGLFSEGFSQALAQNLDGLYQSGGTQYAVLTLSDLDGSAIEAASIKITDQWKLGHKGKDDGVLILIAKSEHRIRIEVGYGLEGVLTDARCSDVIRNTMVPLMREGDAQGAVTQALDILMGLSDPQAAQTSQSSLPKDNNSDISMNPLASFPLPLMILFFLVVLPLLIRILFGFGGGGRFYGGGGFGGFGGGGFGGGGFGGGGFSGGGGGGFGGGGASGGW